MKKLGVLAALIICGACTVGNADARPGQRSLDQLLTTAEASNYMETSRYQDVVDFVTDVAAQSPLIHLTTFGYSYEGRRIPLLVVGDVTDGTPEAVRASGKTVVYLQGSIHAGEVPGKEALQVMLRNIAEGEYSEWFDDLVLLIAPIYNVDGTERVLINNRGRQNGPYGGMGQRPNAQGYDLNRDHMKLMSPEAKSLARVWSEYNPHVGVDFHTTNGSFHAYHNTYSVGMHPATDGDIVSMLRDDYMPQLTQAVKQKYGWDYYYYGNGGRGAEPVWRTFDYRPRFNNNYLGLRNRLGILSEAYSYDTFENRILSSLYFGEEVLNYASANAVEIRRLVEASDAKNLIGTQLPVAAELVRSDEMVDILMGEVEEVVNPYSGQRVYNRLEASRPVKMWEEGTYRGTESATVPATYLLLSDLKLVVDRLAFHGVQTRTLSQEQSLEVEVFDISGTTANEREYQGVHERTIEGSYRTVTRTLPAGTTVVDMSQPLARLIFSLIEPRATDGFVHWAVMDPHMVSPSGAIAAEYPVLRTHEPVN